MSFTLMSRSLIRVSKDLLERKIALSGKNGINSLLYVDLHPQQCRNLCMTTHITINGQGHKLFTKNPDPSFNALLLGQIRQQSKKPAAVEQRDESDSESDSDDEQKRKQKTKFVERGDSEFWRRKMRTLHRILDVNRDGVISFDDFNLLAKRFTDLGHLSPEVSAEFNDVLKQIWEEQFGEISTYNLITAEQFLTDLHHRLNDKKMAKRLGRFLPYLFKAVDYDHSGHLDLDQYKLFFRCLGLTDEDAAIAFAVIDKNGDGQLSMKEFVHLGRQYFLTENETKISKMFWGPLIDH